MTSSSQDRFVTLGQFGRPHGLNGWISVHSASDLTQYDTCYISTPTGWTTLPIDNIRGGGSKTIIHLKNIDTIEEAKTYCGKEIAVLRTQFPQLPEGEYYWTDLAGMTVINQEQQILGVIDHLFRTGANDVVVVTGTEKKHLIPFIQDQTILQIDADKHQMIVDWDREF